MHTHLQAHNSPRAEKEEAASRQFLSTPPPLSCQGAYHRRLLPRQPLQGPQPGATAPAPPSITQPGSPRGEGASLRLQLQLLLQRQGEAEQGMKPSSGYSRGRDQVPSPRTSASAETSGPRLVPNKQVPEARGPQAAAGDQLPPWSLLGLLSWTGAGTAAHLALSPWPTAECGSTACRSAPTKTLAPYMDYQPCPAKLLCSFPTGTSSPA